MAKAIEWDYVKFKGPQFVPNVKVPVVGLAKFRILGEEDPDTGQNDFQDALHDVRQCIHWSQKKWNAGEQRWHVWVSDDVRKLLCDVFSNAANLFDAADRQMDIFDVLESEAG